MDRWATPSIGGRIPSSLETVSDSSSAVEQNVPK